MCVAHCKTTEASSLRQVCTYRSARNDEDTDACTAVVTVSSTWRHGCVWDVHVACDMWHLIVTCCTCRFDIRQHGIDGGTAITVATRTELPLLQRMVRHHRCDMRVVWCACAIRHVSCVMCHVHALVSERYR